MPVPAFAASWAPTVHSLLRIIAGLMFLLHGTQKMIAFPVGIPGMDAPPPMMSKVWIAGMLEVVLGALIAVGLFTRLASFIASGEMAVAYFMGHAPNGFWPTVNQGELAVLYCWLFFYFAFIGGGPISIDALIRRRL